MSIRNLLTTQFVAVIILCYLSLTEYSEAVLSGIEAKVRVIENIKMSGKCLRYKDANANNYDMELAPCDEKAPSQQLIVTEVDPISCTMKFVGSSKCWDVMGGTNFSDGVPVGQYACNAAQLNQQWAHLILINEKVFSSLAIGGRQYGTPKCLTPVGNGSSMVLGTCRTLPVAAHQYWRVWHESGMTEEHTCN